jgi:hypothetical protein
LHIIPLFHMSPRLLLRKVASLRDGLVVLAVLTFVTTLVVIASTRIPPPNAAKATIITGCVTDADCASPQHCDTSTGQCSSACFSDQDCGAGYLCAFGQCQPVFGESSSIFTSESGSFGWDSCITQGCPPFQWCDPLSGMCMGSEPSSSLSCFYPFSQTDGQRCYEVLSGPTHYGLSIFSDKATADAIAGASNSTDGSVLASQCEGLSGSPGEPYVLTAANSPWFRASGLWEAQATVYVSCYR